MLVLIFNEQTVDKSECSLDILVDYILWSVSRPGQPRLLQQPEGERHVLQPLLVPVRLQVELVQWHKVTLPSGIIA